MLFIVFTLACKEKKREFIPATTIIDGQIASVEVPVITLKSGSDIKSPIDQQGKFRISTQLDKPGIYNLVIHEQNVLVFLVPGDKISITGDYRTIPASIKFTGDHANENNYLIAYEKRKTETQPLSSSEFFTQPESQFLEAVENRTLTINNDQQEYQKQNGLFDAQFADFMAHEISYEDALYKLYYPLYFHTLKPDSTLTLSDTYDSFLQNIELDSEENLTLPSYRNFLINYLDYKFLTDKSASAKGDAERKFDLIGKNFQKTKVREFLYSHLMKQLIDLSINDAARLMPEYLKIQSDSTQKSDVQMAYQEWSNLLPGKPSPKFTYTSVNNKLISLENIIEQGKVIYMDIWATWCIPCLQELPNLEVLQSEFSDQGINFVSISVDKDKKAWHKMVKEKNMKGIQLIADRGNNSSIIHDYLIKSIPRFIILDKNGLIVHANAPRPSSKEIRKMLHSALTM
jgi:thiol-disulfide isomerase/thioredoxin